MTYEIEWAVSALRELRKLDHQAARRVLVAVSKLAADPRPSASRALSGQPSGTLRLRVGHHRVIYHVEDQRVVVTVVRVAHRREAYRDLWPNSQATTVSATTRQATTAQARGCR